MSEFELFWGGPFSQWCPSPFKLFAGEKFNCAEQFMMYYKALFFKDLDKAKEIIEAKDPGYQKKLGRQVKGFDKERWSEVARGIVYYGNFHKFTQNPKLFIELINTYPKTIVEASPYDRIWGIGLGEENPQAHDKSQWRGLNWLGEVLTELRYDLMNFESTKKISCGMLINDIEFSKKEIGKDWWNDEGRIL